MITFLRLPRGAERAAITGAPRVLLGTITDLDRHDLFADLMKDAHGIEVMDRRGSDNSICGYQLSQFANTLAKLGTMPQARTSTTTSDPITRGFSTSSICIGVPTL
ncbi:hypothetical protein A9D60_18665 [Leisingera sp. JC1]|nr:hypothetical protein A9D60_18665 [Leisingera sp. JC1]